MRVGEVERALNDLCVQVAAVERSGIEIRTAFNIHFRIPERAIPMIISPAAHKTLAALRERVQTYGKPQQISHHKDMEHSLMKRRQDWRMAYAEDTKTRQAMQYFEDVARASWARENAETSKDKVRGACTNPLVSGGIRVKDVTPISNKPCAYQARKVFSNYQGSTRKMKSRPPRLYIVYDGNGDLTTFLRSMPTYPDRVVDLVHFLHVKFIIAFLDQYAHEKDQGGDLQPWPSGIRHAFAVELPKLGVLWEKVCRPIPV